MPRRLRKALSAVLTFLRQLDKNAQFPFVKTAQPQNPLTLTQYASIARFFRARNLLVRAASIKVSGRSTVAA